MSIAFTFGTAMLVVFFCLVVIPMAFAALIMSSKAARQAEEEGAVWLASSEPRSAQEQAYCDFLSENTEVPYSAFGAGGGDGWLEEEVA